MGEPKGQNNFTKTYVSEYGVIQSNDTKVRHSGTGGGGAKGGEGRREYLVYIVLYITTDRHPAPYAPNPPPHRLTQTRVCALSMAG